MKKLPLVFALAFVFFTISQTGYSQSFPYHLYAPRTISELNELNSKVEAPTGKGTTKIAISASPFYSAVRMEYAGQSRKLSKEKRGLFNFWAKSLNVKGSNTDFNLLDLIEREYLFAACNEEYWLTVQTPAANDFPKDMKKGDKITLYLMVVGGIEVDNKWEFVYLANSFKVY